MKKEILNVRLSTFDYQTLNFICEKYKCSKADAIKMAITLLAKWDSEQCHKDLATTYKISQKNKSTVKYEKGIE